MPVIAIAFRVESDQGVPREKCLEGGSFNIFNEKTGRLVLCVRGVTRERDKAGVEEAAMNRNDLPVPFFKCCKAFVLLTMHANQSEAIAAVISANNS
jgi:hypothetical protein